MDDFEDLLGGNPEPVRKKRGRPTREEAARRAAEAAAAEQAEKERVEGFYATPEGRRLINAAATGRTTEEERNFHLPCSQNFIARVLRLDPMTVNRRLRAVKPVGYAGNGANKRSLYDFADTLPYLLKPKMDLGTYLKTLNAADLPNSINKAFWEAERIKNKTLMETAEAWPTERVLGVLGQVFMMIKDRLPLIKEGMRDTGLTDDQMRLLESFSDQFQADLHEALVALPQAQSTPSRRADVDMGDDWIEDEVE